MTWCSFDPKLRVYDMVLGSGHAKLQECDIEKELQKMVSHSSCEDSDALKSGENAYVPQFA